MYENDEEYEAEESLEPMEEQLDYPDISADIDEAISLAAPFHMRWNRCLEFVRGNQSALYDMPNYSYGTAKPMRGKQSVQFNKLLPLLRNITARLATAYPAMAVLPASDSPEDILKSRASEMALRYHWSADKIKEKLGKAINLLVNTGNVGLHEYFNAKTKDVEVEIIKPFDLVFEPYVTDLSESEWVVIRCYTTKRELLKLYPEHHEAIEEYAPSADKKTTGPQSIPNNRVEYRHVYWKDGRRAIMLGKHYLWTGVTPHNIVPVQHLVYSKIEGFLWGIGLIEPLLDIQILYNETRTQIIKNIKQATNPKILCWEDSLRDPSKAFTQEVGEKVWVNEGRQAPAAFSFPPLPGYVLDEPGRLDLELQDASGIHAVSLGKRVSGLSSGKAINALSQNDMSQLQLTQEYIEAAVKDMATSLLVLMQEHYTEGKMYRMMDASGIVVFQEIKHTDFVETPEIFLEAGTLFRSEAQDREAKAIEMLELGLITPEEAKNIISTRLAPLDLAEKMDALRQARDLLEAVVKFGAPIDVYPTDDTTTLSKVFKRFIDSLEFYQLPPERQDKVAEAYRTILAAKMPIAAPQTGLGGPQTPPVQPDDAAMNDAMQGMQEQQLEAAGLAAPTADVATLAGTGEQFIPQV